MVSPTVTIIGGPNGAGKTTFSIRNFAKEIEEGCFINADQMAQELKLKLPNISDREIARRALERRNSFIHNHKNFLIETTLATLTLKQALIAAREQGYNICFYYLWLSSPRLCDFRVKDRVSKGGHNIPLEIILRRYALSLKYFKDYLAIANTAYIYNADAHPDLIAYKENDNLTILKKKCWEDFQQNIDVYYI